MGLLALLCLWWFFTTWNYLPLIFVVIFILLYFFKIARRIFSFLLALLLLCWLLVQTDFIQNIIVGKVTKRLSKELKTEVSIKHVSFYFFDKMNLEGTMIRDHNKDTLLYAGALKVRITDWFFWKTYADLKYIGLEDAIIKQNRVDSNWNFKFIADYFASSDTVKTPVVKPDNRVDSTKKSIVFNIKKVDLKNVTYISDDGWVGTKMVVKVGNMTMDADTIDVGRKLYLINSIELDKPYFTIENYNGNRLHPPPPTVDTGMYFNGGDILAKIKTLTITNGYFGNLKRGEKSDKGVFDGDNIQLSKLNASFKNFSFLKDTIRANINIAAKERSGFELKKLQAAFKLTPQIMEFKEFTLETPKTHITDYYAMRFKDFNKDIGEYVEKTVMDARFKNAQVNSDDIAYFAPDLSTWHRQATISGRFTGTVSDFKIANFFLRTSANTYVSGNLAMKGLPDVDKTSININNAVVQTNSSEISFLYPPLKTLTDPNMAALGNVRYQGAISGTLVNYNINGNLSTLLGGIYTKLTLSFPHTGEPVYKGHIETQQFNLGKFINADNIGSMGFTGDVDGYSFALSKIKTSIDGKFSSLEFNGYKYANLSFNGAIQKGKFDGDFKADDPNFDLTSHIAIDLTGEKPAFNILGDLETAKLKALNFTNADFQLTGLFDLNFQGRNIDEFVGSAKLLNAQLMHDSSRLDFDSLAVTAFLDSANRKVLTVSSNQFDVNVVGEQYKILDLPTSFQTFLSHYYPAYINAPDVPAQNQHFAVTINTRDFDKYARLIDSNLSGLNNAHIVGRINTADTGFTLLAQIPGARYGKYKVEDAELKGIGDYDTLTLIGNIGRIYVSDSLYFPNSTVNIKSSNDFSTVHVATSANTTLNDAKLNANIFTLPDGVHIDFEPSSFVLNDKKWDLEKEGELIIKKDYASASNVKFTQGFQEIAVETDKNNVNNLVVKLKSVDIGDIVPLFTSRPRMEGVANGNVYLRDFFNKFTMDANLQADQFRLNDDSVGVVNIVAGYSNETGKATWNVKSANENYDFNIVGSYNTKDSLQSPLSVTTHLNNTKVNLLNDFLGDIFGDITGLATGDLKTFGDPNSLQFSGKVTLRNAGLTVKYTQVRYTVDSAVIDFRDDGIDFGEFKVYDKYRRMGTVRGVLYEKGFKNMRFDFYMNTNKMLLLDTKPRDNQQFYGKAIGKASLSFTGPEEDMRMSITGEVNDTTHIFIPITNGRESSEVDFIRFKQYGKEIFKPKDNTRLSMDLDLTANNKAQIDVILDELTGDVIKATGNGRMRIKIPANGSMTMNGRYNIEQGKYDFNFQSLIKKPFDLPPDANSYIEWTGDPYNANIHITAQYTAHNVSVNDLIGNGAFQVAGSAVQGYRGDVYVYADLTQKLTKPNIDFRLGFPPESPISNDQTFKLFLQKIDKQPDEKLKQVTWLMVFGSFAPYGQGLGGGNDNLVRSAGINTISAKVSEQINKAVAGVLAKSGLQFTVSTSTYSSAQLYGGSASGSRLDRQNVDLKFAAKLLNGKLIITFGSGLDFNLSNASAVQSGNFQWLPDFSVQIILSRNAFKGTQLKAMVFNKSSLDVNSTSGGLGRRIRQGINISYSFDFPVEKDTVTFKQPPASPKPAPALPLRDTSHRDTTPIINSNIDSTKKPQLQTTTGGRK